MLRINRTIVTQIKPCPNWFKEETSSKILSRTIFEKDVSNNNTQQAYRNSLWKRCVKQQHTTILQERSLKKMCVTNTNKTFFWLIWTSLWKRCVILTQTGLHRSLKTIFSRFPLGLKMTKMQSKDITTTVKQPWTPSTTATITVDCVLQRVSISNLFSLTNSKRLLIESKNNTKESSNFPEKII